MHGSDGDRDGDGDHDGGVRRPSSFRGEAACGHGLPPGARAVAAFGARGSDAHPHAVTSRQSFVVAPVAGFTLI